MLTVTLGLQVSNFFKSEQVEVHSSFSEPVNVGLRLDVFNFLPIFRLICSWFCKNFESIDVNFSGHVWNTVQFLMLCPGMGAGGSTHRPEKYAKSHVFLCFSSRFLLQKWKQPPPKGIWEPKLWRSWRNSAGGTVWFCNFGRKIRLNFGEDLFFVDHLFFGGKLIQEQWKFASRSLTVVSTLQKSPSPP